MYYKFVKVTNNNTHDFFIDITTMKDIRIRMSILNRKYALYYYGKAPYHPVFSTAEFTRKLLFILLLLQT
jgi:hypothetical protein